MIYVRKDWIGFEVFYGFVWEECLWRNIFMFFINLMYYINNIFNIILYVYIVLVIILI